MRLLVFTLSTFLFSTNIFAAPDYCPSFYDLKISKVLSQQKGQYYDSALSLLANGNANLSLADMSYIQNSFDDNLIEFRRHFEVSTLIVSIKIPLLKAVVKNREVVGCIYLSGSNRIVIQKQSLIGGN